MLRIVRMSLPCRQGIHFLPEIPMVDKRAQELIDLGNRLYRTKLPFDGLCQELAWQFAPDLADFTRKIVLGEEWNDHVMDSYPIQASRDLSNSLSAMLRPKDRPWFKCTTLDDEMDADEENARFLEYLTKTIRSNLYNPRAKFVRATKEADRFYVNFGQAIIQIDEDHSRTHLIFRNRHLRDACWLENRLGDVDHLHIKEPMTARQMIRQYRAQWDKIHQSVKKAADEEPNKEFDVRLVCMPRDEYDYSPTMDPRKLRGMVKARKVRTPFVLIHIDATNNLILKEEGRVAFPFVVPRWHRFANFQYAFSPATMPGLSDARMSQMLAQILMEAGEKAVNPPLLARENVIREANLQAGAISWADIEYDEKLTDAMTPLSTVTGHMATGFEMRKHVHEMIGKSFFLDKLTLPEAGSQMTATEVQRRLEEHVRNLLPLFEPMEVEYNTKLLDTVFTYLRSMQKFDWAQMPKSMIGADIAWSFESPIQQAQLRLMVEQAKATWEVEAIAMKFGAEPQTNTSLVARDAVRGVGGPATWRLSPEEMQAIAAQKQQAQTMQGLMQMVGGGAEVAGKVGEAATKLRDGGVLPPPGSGGADQGAGAGNPMAALMGAMGGGGAPGAVPGAGAPMAPGGLPIAPVDPSADLGAVAA
jgi:hypothetical protein